MEEIKNNPFYFKEQQKIVDYISHSLYHVYYEVHCKMNFIDENQPMDERIKRFIDLFKHEYCQYIIPVEIKYDYIQGMLFKYINVKICPRVDVGFYAYENGQIRYVLMTRLVNSFMNILEPEVQYVLELVYQQIEDYEAENLLIALID